MLYYATAGNPCGTATPNHNWLGSKRSGFDLLVGRVPGALADRVAVRGASAHQTGLYGKTQTLAGEDIHLASKTLTSAS
jgi:hypothetical protein